MSDNVTITFTAKDGTTPILVKISGAAKQAGAELQKAGVQGKKAMTDIEQSTKKTDAGLRTFERNSLAVGAAMGALALGVIKVSAAYQTQERQLAALERMYGEASARAIEYAESIQLTTRYSNDAARQSLILLNTLSQNYGISQDQIETLLTRATDLAQLHGRSLTEVTQMIQNALRGEAEYIEQLGVTLNQTFVASEAAARGLGNFISGMTQAEQAAFRYTLLLEQTASAQGYAMEAAEGTRGAISLLINEVQDGAQVFGGFLGPVGQVAAEFNAYALWLPLIASQVGRVTALFINMGDSVRTMSNQFSVAQTRALKFGGVLTLVTVALGVIAAKWLEEKQAQAQAEEQARMTAEAYEQLEQSVAQMYLNGNIQAAEWADAQVDALQTFMAEWQRFSQGMQDDMPTDPNSGFLGLWGIPDAIFSGTASLLTGGWYAEWREGRNAAREAKREFIESLEVTPEEEQRIAASFQRVLSLSNNPYIDQAQFEQDFDAFMSDLFAGINSGDILANEIDDELNAFFNRYSETISRGAAQTEAAKSELERAFELSDLRMDGWTEGAIEQLERFDRLVTQVQMTIDNVNNTSIGTGIFNYMDGFVDTSKLKFTAEQTELLAMSFDRLGDVINSGDWNNAAINNNIELLNALFMSGQIDAQQYTELIILLSLEYDQFGTAADVAAQGQAKLGHAMEQTLSPMERLVELAGELNRAFQMEGAGGDLARSMRIAARDLEELASMAPEVLASSLAEERRGATEQLDLMLEERRQFIEDYFSLTGADDPLMQINATSLANEYSVLANEITRSGQAIETVFRVIVGNTDAWKSQADSIKSWADELINVAGEAGRIDELLSGGFINETQYNAAQQAYNSIAESTEAIANNVDAIQAKQAPFIAGFLEQQSQWIAGLNEMDEAQQRIALGFADQATTSLFFESIQMGAQLARMDIADMDGALQTLFEGFVQSSPFLFDMLESVGILSGTPLDFTVNIDELLGAQSEIAALTDELRSLTSVLAQIFGIEIEVEGEEEVEDVKRSIDELLADSAREVAINISTKIDGVGGAGQSLGDKIRAALGGDGAVGDGTGGSMEIPVQPVIEQGVSPEQLLAVVGRVELPVFPVVQDQPGGGAMMSPLEPVEMPVTLDPDTSAVDNAISQVSGQSYDGPLFNFTSDSSMISAAVSVWQSAIFTGPTFDFAFDAFGLVSATTSWKNQVYNGPTFTFVGDDSSLRAVISRYTDGAVIATQYVNIVGRTTGLSPFAHGGLASYAHGGTTQSLVPIHAGEHNWPEIARFANGGSAMLPQEGVYFVPPMTMISPSNAVRGTGAGGGAVNLSINTGNLYGMQRPDLQRWAEIDLLPAIVEAFSDSDRSRGM